MTVIFLSKARYMKRTGVLQISVTLTATYQQHEHIITKHPQVNVSSLKSFTQLQKVNVIHGQL